MEGEGKMEEGGFKKDETPYYVFPCSKCKNYSYVKTTQKGKKCLRCGRTNQVKKPESVAELVHGIMAAKDRVIELQNELAQKELGSMIDLRAENDFSLSVSERQDKIKKSSTIKERDREGLDEMFREILANLQKKYRKFPLYLIEIAALDRGISKEELKFLIPRYIRKNILERTSNDLFHLGTQ